MSRRKKLAQLSPPIAHLLGRVRNRIRKIVLGEGLAISLVVLLTTFWIAFALDFLPIKFGYSEIPIWGRAVLLGLSAIAVTFIFFRSVVARLLVRLKDTSMAILVERNYHEFNDSLLTTVSGFVDDDRDTSDNEILIAETKRKAESLVDQVDIKNVVRSSRLRWATWIAGALLCSAAVLVIASPSIASLAFKRLYLLNDEKWPRQTDLEFAGISVKRDTVIDSIEEFSTQLRPHNGIVTVAKGSSLTIGVTAKELTDDSGSPRKLNIPDTCWLNYRSLDGAGGSTPFRRIGAPRAGKQHYSLEGGPIENVIGDLILNVYGGDDRIAPITIRVVDKPAVEKTDLHLQFPEYLVDETSASYVDRVEVWTGQKRVPEGTRVKIAAKSRVKLSKVYVRLVDLSEKSASPDTDSTMQALSAQGDRFEFELPVVDKQTSVEFYLCDIHGVVNEIPHTVTIDAIQDQAPEIDFRLAGIGTAVTPDVQIPLKIELTDDYGLHHARLEIEVGDEVPMAQPLPVETQQISTTIDFRQQREQQGEKFRLPVDGQAQLSLIVAATDRFNLNGSPPNVGASDRYDLQVVLPEELLRMLEQAEVGQRRRLEQIIREIEELRDYLVRAKSADSNVRASSTEPGDRIANRQPGDMAATDDPRRDELRRLFAQRAILQNDKSNSEISACIRAFEDLRLQLINNRLNADARQKRFEDQVIAPLQHVTQVPIAELASQLDQLEQRLREIETAETDGEQTDQNRLVVDQLASDAIQTTDQILLELNSVLNLLIKHETQNELLDIVRQMIQQQTDLRERTKKQRQKKAFEGLLD